MLPLCFFACGEADIPSKLIDANAFEKIMQIDPSAQIIDVRTPEEYQGGHIERALNFDIKSSDFEQNISKLDKEKVVLIYCGVGARSAKAASRFQKAGFDRVYDLTGGLTAWKEAGKKVIP